MTPRDRIASVLAGFIGNRVSESHFSPIFGIHEGRTLRDWIDHEIHEFWLRCQAFDLDTWSMTVEVDHADPSGEVSFSVLNSAGAIAYQDTWIFDDEGRVRGNGKAFEMVSKLRFQSGTPTRRALAIRSVTGTITSVVPIGVLAAEAELNPGSSEDYDGFAAFSMLVEDDSLVGMPAKFRIADSSGRRATESVWMRGVDGKGFQTDLFPVIDGKAVHVPGTSSGWMLNVILKDGRRDGVEHPDPAMHVFSSDVQTAILTDALDHDWVVSLS